MLGCGSLGQYSLGQMLDVPPVAPHGAANSRFEYAPEPPYDVKPHPPFRPVWDKPREGKVEQQPPQPRPVSLPPASIFAAPPDEALPPVTSTVPFGLPDFHNLVPPDPVGPGQRTQEAQDMSDARDALDAIDTLAVLRSLGPNSVN